LGWFLVNWEMLQVGPDLPAQTGAAGAPACPSTIGRPGGEAALCRTAGLAAGRCG